MRVELKIWQRKNLQDFFKKEIKVPRTLNGDLEAFNYFKELGKQCQCDYWRGLELHCNEECKKLANCVNNDGIQTYIAYYRSLARICARKLKELGA